MIRRPAVLFIFVVSAVIVGESVLAQGSTDSQLGQSRRELERTDELIVHAREAVRISNSAIAAQALDRAEKLQAGAREAHRNREYPMALSLTRKAREQASLAISNSRLSEQLEGVVQGRLERAREMLERVRETLPTPLSPALATILDQARTNLSQALEFYRQRRFRAAVKLVEQVEQAARRLTSIAQLTNRAEGEFDRRAENVLRLIEHARELLVDCGSAQSREHLEHAEETLRLARRLHSDNQPRAAQMALSRAREAALRAARECQGGQEGLQRRCQHLKGEADRMAERLAGDGSPQAEAARGLLEQAQNQLRLAHKYLAQAEEEAAQMSLQAAQLALRQVQRYITGRP